MSCALSDANRITAPVIDYSKLSRAEMDAIRDGIRAELHRRHMAAQQGRKRRAAAEVHGDLPAWAVASLNHACALYGVSPRDVCGYSRATNVVAARWMLWRAMRAHRWSNNRIAGLFGMDTTSVRYALQFDAPRVALRRLDVPAERVAA